jgi:hypothetical protein
MIFFPKPAGPDLACGPGRVTTFANEPERRGGAFPLSSWFIGDQSLLCKTISLKNAL